MQLDLGQKIRELRRRDGRTQEALAEAIGVTSQVVSRWEAKVIQIDCKNLADRLAYVVQSRLQPSGKRNQIGSAMG